MPAAAGILRDNHLLITGLGQRLTRLTESHVLIILAICHLASQHLNPLLPFRVSMEGRAHLPLQVLKDARYSLAQQQVWTGARPISYILPVDVEPVTRDAEKQWRGECSQRPAAAVTDPTCRWQNPGPGGPKGEVAWSYSRSS